MGRSGADYVSLADSVFLAVCARHRGDPGPAIRGSGTGACRGRHTPGKDPGSDAFSRTFNEERNVRVFLPPDYDESSSKRYPAVYFFHGWGERYNRPSQEVGDYDRGYGGDNLSSYVGSHDLIVVKWDGYNPRHTGEAYPRPYNIGPVETERQFPLYFPELVAYIDANFRTIPGRDHRGVCGISMGGFMAYWVTGKYPHLVGSASNFMGSAEFVVGPKEAPVEYLHTPLYGNYEGVRTRLVVGTDDFIRWYHRRMNAVWRFTRAAHETEEFKSKHGTPGMAKTLDFHMNAFRNPLPKTELWHHADVYPSFEVWGYAVETDRQRPGFTLLENVSSSGFRSSVREWLPDGKVLGSVGVRITTDAAYVPGREYLVQDVNVDTGEARASRQVADAAGRLFFSLNGERHEVGISDAQQPLLTVPGWKLASGALPLAGRPVSIRLRLTNKGTAPARAILVRAESHDPGVRILNAAVRLPSLAPGSSADTAGQLRFEVRAAEREVMRLVLRVETPDFNTRIPQDIPLFPSTPFPNVRRGRASNPAGRAGRALPEVVVADGRELALWERAIHTTRKTLGSGNGDGLANAGETIALLLRDGDAYRAAELFTYDPCVDMTARLSDYWGEYDHVGASAKISLPTVAAGCPAGHAIEFFARWQFPNKPEHILKQGIVRVTVGGRAKIEKSSDK